MSQIEANNDARSTFVVYIRDSAITILPSYVLVARMRYFGIILDQLMHHFIAEPFYCSFLNWENGFGLKTV